MRLLTDIEGLDPAHIRSPTENYMAWNIYNSLVRYVPGSTEIEPDLAEEYEVSDDGLTYTFHLRDGVTWHKGYGELTADDVVYSLERHRDPDTASRYSSQFAAVETIEAVDDSTVVITMARPDPALLTGVLPFRAGWIVNQEAVEEFGEGYGLNPVGTGPFVFESYTPGESGVLVANMEYYEGPPAVERAVFVPVLEDTTAEAALRSGELDIAYIRSPDVYERLQQDDSVQLVEDLLIGSWNLYLNLDRPAMQDLSVRQAVSHAIDRQGLTDVALRGLAEPAYNFINRAIPGHADDVARYEYDPDEARRLLEEAGATGTPLRLLISTLEPWPELAPALQEMLSAVGFEVEMELTEYGTWYEQVDRGDYDIAAMGLVRPPDPVVYISESLHSSQAGAAGNHSRYEGADELIEEAWAETDGDAREAMYQDIQHLVAEDLPIVPVFYLKVVAAMRPGVEGFPVGILNDMWLFDARVSE